MDDRLPDTRQQEAAEYQGPRGVSQLQTDATLGPARAPGATFEETILDYILTGKPSIEPITVALHIKKETKGTFCFESDDAAAVVTTLYIRKAAFPSGKPPSTVHLTIQSQA